MDKTVLSLDLSTTSTGWAFFKKDTEELLDYGLIKPSNKGLAKLRYPEKQLRKMNDLSEKIVNLIVNLKPSLIVIEEIAGSKQRLGQKTLDGFHYILVSHFDGVYNFDNVHYFDVTGGDGWRSTYLQLRLDDADKLANKEAKKLNKTLSGKQKLPVIGPKHLACRYANRIFGTDLNVDLRGSDADKADAICMGHAFIKYKCTKL